jgi:outer membrane protein OmpA-like peptidoglycan-associated protein
MRFPAAIFFVSLIIPTLAYAQNNLEGYVPPPLFAEPKEPPPKPDNGVPTLPSLSKPVEDKSVLSDEGEVKKEKPDIQFFDDAPPPEEKQPPRQASDITAPKPETKPDTAPDPVPVKTEPVKEKSKPRSEGVVRGPKTMPANKKGKVDSEITYEVLDPPETNILERVQVEENKKPEEPAIEAYTEPETNPNITLPEMTTQKDGSRKVVMLYGGEKAELTEEQKYILDKTIIKTLRNNPFERVLIESYASSANDLVRSDRRLSLSRALHIRDRLLENKIESSRIDVRALGSETNMQPVDRVEFYLIP